MGSHHSAMTTRTPWAHTHSAMITRTPWAHTHSAMTTRTPWAHTHSAMTTRTPWAHMHSDGQCKSLHRATKGVDLHKRAHTHGCMADGNEGCMLHSWVTAALYTRAAAAFLTRT
eukprot:1151802-Pelagomonas_calceolata.AAC.8